MQEDTAQETRSFAAFVEEYLGRIVVLLSPVFVALAGLVGAWLADLGVESFDERELTAIFLGVAAFATASLVTWLRNRGHYEERKDFELAAESADNLGPNAMPLGMDPGKPEA